MRTPLTARYRGISGDVQPFPIPLSRGRRFVAFGPFLSYRLLGLGGPWATKAVRRRAPERPTSGQAVMSPWTRTAAEPAPPCESEAGGRSAFRLPFGMRRADDELVASATTPHGSLPCRVRSSGQGGSRTRVSSCRDYPPVRVTADSVTLPPT